LYRRPGGDAALGTLLDPANYDQLTHEPYLKSYADSINWLKIVFDYSGWHVSAGDSQPSSKKVTGIALARRVVSGEKGYQGVTPFLCTPANQKRAAESAQGLLIQLFDNDKLTADAIPSIILQLRSKGAQFFPLPRPVDQPNAFVLGVEDPPTIDTSAPAVACNAQVTITPTPKPSATPTSQSTASANLLATSTPN
jgi:hypothetical protein